MRPAYTIDLEHDCIFIKWSGVITAHDAIAFNREIAQDLDYHPGLNRLIDLRQAKFRMSIRDIREMTMEVIEKRDAIEGHRKGAMLVGGDLEYGLLRIINAITDQTYSDVRPFRRLDEAVAWLGLSETLGDPFETMNQG